MLCVPHLPQRRRLRSIAVLTSGGDAPGMNAAIRAIVRYGIAKRIEVHGVMRGFSGLLEGSIEPLGAASVANILQRGGTILKTSRCPEFRRKAARREAAGILRSRGIEALVVIGGDGSFAGAWRLERETGLATLGVPATIDNDVAGTEEAIGFDTAVNTAVQAIDRIRDTASAHDRTFIVEVMGRCSGFIAACVGIGGGAETILVPERKQSLAQVCAAIERGMRRGKTSSIIVVAEGGRPGRSAGLAHDLERRGYPSRVCILGHTQRGGVPSAHDRVLASVLGASAVAALLAGRSGAMVGVQRDRVVLVGLRAVAGRRRDLPSAPIVLAHTLAA
jgi:6-phosphofructokinase 1